MKNISKYDSIGLTKLKQLRIKNRFTCNEMAKKLNVCTAFYWQIENCKRGLYYSMAKKIASIFKMKPDEIFFDEIN